MAGKLQFNLQDYQEAAHKYRSDLLMLPIIGIEETLKFMTGRPGIRYKESVAAISGDAQFAPYKPARRSDFNLNFDFRTLETFFGSVVAQFEPNSAVSTLLGAVGATKGDGQMQTPTAKHVLALIAKSLSEPLNNAIWAGVRNATGDTTLDLFDGFDTITQAEITAGKIAVDQGNYMKLTDEITTANAVDIAKEILFSLDPRLRAQTCYMFCSQDFADKYNEAYLLTHAGINYNTQYDQTAVEGSNGRLILCPSQTVIVQQVQSPEAQADAAATIAAMREYANVMRQLKQRLDEPFVTVNTVAGDKGIKQAQEDYDKLIRNKTPKSRRK